MSLLLGVDTGGTYTDAVLIRDEAEVIASAKALTTREDLAEQSVDDLEDVEGLEPEKAGELIMAARAHWFEEAEKAEEAEQAESA